MYAPCSGTASWGGVMLSCTAIQVFVHDTAELNTGLAGR
nr:MAG TPA_asm: hypothetical protein [Caudoviricetes sp.]